VFRFILPVIKQIRSNAAKPTRLRNVPVEARVALGGTDVLVSESGKDNQPSRKGQFDVTAHFEWVSNRCGYIDKFSTRIARADCCGVEQENRTVGGVSAYKIRPQMHWFRTVGKTNPFLWLLNPVGALWIKFYGGLVS
jgi:hypothetical protein